MRILFKFITIILVCSSAGAADLKHLVPGQGQLMQAQIDADLKEQAVDLEAVLISTMIEPMFPRGRESGLYGGGKGSDIYRQMMITQYGKILSQSNGLGLADSITKDLMQRGE